MTTQEVIDFVSEAGLNGAECYCLGCNASFRVGDIWCAQPNDLAECPKCHSVELEFRVAA